MSQNRITQCKERRNGQKGMKNNVGYHNETDYIGVRLDTFNCIAAYCKHGKHHYGLNFTSLVCYFGKIMKVKQQ